MLQRRMTRGEEFRYRHPVTGDVLVRVKIIEFRGGGEVVIGIEAPDGVSVALDGSSGDESPPNKKSDAVSIV